MFGKLLGAMIGLGIGLAFQSAIAAFALSVLGVLIGHRVDTLHEMPELDEDPALAGFDEDPDEDVDAQTEEEELALANDQEGFDDDRDEPGAGSSGDGGASPDDEGDGTDETDSDDDVRDEGDDEDEDEPEPEAEPARPVISPLPRATATAVDFTAATCGLLVELARIDGDVNRDEIAAVKEYFEDTLHFGASSLQRVRNELKAALADRRDLEALAERCRAKLDARARVKFLDAAYQVSLADGELRKSERDALRTISRILGITDEAHRELTRAYFGDGAEHYARLGVDADATDDELKTAFRRLAAERHPDRFAHAGKAAVDAATEEFRLLQTSYEELRRIRNF